MKEKEIYKDKKYSPAERAKDLVKRMTLDEKLDQLVITGCNAIGEYVKRLDAGEKFTVCGTHTYTGFTAEEYNRLQRHMVEGTRLGIPALVDSENTHGICHPAATVYPTTGCLAATFDDSLAYRMGKASGKEAAALGIRQVYAPNVDIARDPRWGRTEENFGEDPFLTGNMATAFVKGIQSEKVAATVKHYLVYGVGEGGLNLAPAHIGEREVRDTMLPPFADCIKKGKVWSVMPSYNEIDGEPVHASKKWMIDVLRKELKFDGVVVSDYGAISMFGDFHRICETKLEAGKIALENQVDLEACEAYGYGEEFRAAVKRGEISEKKVDALVKRVLELKFKVGLFDEPYLDGKKSKYIHDEKSVALAREIAEKGIVLLKNDGVLPLKKQVKKVAVIGPNGDLPQLGNYIYYRGMADTEGVSDRSVTLKGALEETFGNENVLYARGSDFVFRIGGELDEAESAARQADVVLLALGDNSREVTGGNQGAAAKRDASKPTVTSGEGFDMPYIELPPAQIELFERVKAAGKPIVMVLYGGKPHAITDQLGACAAVVQMFGAGEEGNKALTDILTGKICPSGKLPFSFPRSTGHIPCFYNYKPSGRGACYKTPGSVDAPGMDYVVSSPEPLFPFGYGLSYTKFVYKNLQARQTGRRKIEVSVEVTNDGGYDAEESVLVFLSCRYRKITPEVKKLGAYRRISLKRGETKRVEFTLKAGSFEFTDAEMKRETAYGVYDIMIAEQKTAVELRKM